MFREEFDHDASGNGKKGQSLKNRIRSLKRLLAKPVGLGWGATERDLCPLNFVCYLPIGGTRVQSALSPCGPESATRMRTSSTLDG